MRIANGELASRGRSWWRKGNYRRISVAVAAARCSLLAVCHALTAPCRDFACSDTKDTEECVLHFSYCATGRPCCCTRVATARLKIESTYKIRVHLCRSAGTCRSSAPELEDRSR